MRNFDPPGAQSCRNGCQNGCNFAAHKKRAPGQPVRLLEGSDPRSLLGGNAGCPPCLKRRPVTYRNQRESQAKKRGGRTLTGDDVRRIRNSLGWSQNKLARRMYLRDGITVLRWENGYHKIPGPAVRLLEILEQAQQSRGFVHLKEVNE